MPRGGRRPGSGRPRVTPEMPEEVVAAAKAAAEVASAPVKDQGQPAIKPRRQKVPGSGRKAGTAAEKARALALEKARKVGADLGVTEVYTAHDFLMRVYLDPENPLHIRMDAAKAAAPYETPRLISQEVKGDPDQPVHNKSTVEYKVTKPEPQPEPPQPESEHAHSSQRSAGIGAAANSRPI